METIITIELNFYDPETLRLAGIKLLQPAQIQALPGAIPAQGDVVRFSGLNYASGELALFRVESRAHLFGGQHTHRIQLNLGLLVAHQP